MDAIDRIRHKRNIIGNKTAIKNYLYRLSDDELSDIEYIKNNYYGKKQLEYLENSLNMSSIEKDFNKEEYLLKEYQKRFKKK